MFRLINFGAVPALLAGCIIDASEPKSCQGKCDSPQDYCTDPAYGDGQCDFELQCGAPDIDCFVTFETDAEATEWFSEFEAKLAAEELREPRNLLPQTDPRYPRMRELLDQGWQSYQQHIEVGELADHRVGLVLIEDPAVNAFVVPDVGLEHAGLAVMVQTGLIEAGGTDDELLGLIMHELEHAVGLHTFPERKDTFKRYYQVLPGQPEPFGFEQPSDPVAGEAVETAIAIGREVGLQPHPELNGLPFVTGMFFTTLQIAHQSGVQNNPEGCVDAQAGLDLFLEFVRDHFRGLDGALVLGGEGASLDYVTSEYVLTLREQCLAASTASFFDVLSVQLGVSPEDIRAQTEPEDLALVEGKHVVDAIQAVSFDRYGKLRALDEMLYQETGGGIDSLRYFSIEEAADDVTVPVLRGAGADADGLADFFLEVLMTPEQRSECLAIIEAGEVPPYGVDLTDDHHATCWRVWHVRELAERGAPGASSSERRAPRPELEGRLRELRPGAWPRRERLSDYIPDCLSPN